MSVDQPVKFQAKIVTISACPEGAMVLLGHLAKPGQPQAATRKLIDWHRLRSGLPSINRRSRTSINDGMNVVRVGLQRAIKAGEFFDQYCAENLHRVHPTRAPHLPGFSRSLSEALGSKDSGTDWETHWNPWRPIVHIAASFRQQIFRLEHGQALSSADRWLGLADLLLDQSADWVPFVLTQAEGRLFLAGNAGVQFPKSTIMFALER